MLRTQHYRLNDNNTDLVVAERFLQILSQLVGQLSAGCLLRAQLPDHTQTLLGEREQVFSALACQACNDPVAAGMLETCVWTNTDPQKNQTRGCKRFLDGDVTQARWFVTHLLDVEISHDQQTRTGNCRTG